jgi:cell division protein FtsB
MNQKVRSILTVLLIIGSIAIIVTTLVLVVKEKKRARVIEDEIRALEEKKRFYEHENTTLQDRIAYLRSEHAYEKEAKKLNYKNPGERVVVLRRSHIDDEPVNENTEDGSGNVTREKAHYEVWFEYFFNKKVL